MANNFYNAVKRNVSADSTLPTEVYSVPDTKKAILIELDVSNKSTAGVTVTVQLEDESQNQTHSLTGTTINANASTCAITTGVSGTITTSAAHNLILNDRVSFACTAAPSFTDAALPPSGDTVLSQTRIYYVQSVGAGASPTTFTIAESKSASSQLTFDSQGTATKMTKVFLADIVKDAPVPVGGSLKVISGQKLVIESAHANVNDKVYVYASAASAVDCIASVLQEVS